MKPFESAKLLLQRADAHIAEFEALETRFQEINPYRQFTEKDAEGKTLFKAAITEPLPEMLPAIMFDIVNCLRSVLDHAVFDSSIVLGGTPNPLYTKFPFGKTEADAANDLPRKRSEVPEAIRPFLLAFRPYDYANGGNWHLYGLNQIRNNKIHQTLSAMILSNHSIGFGGGGGFLGTLHVDHMEPTWDAEKQELTFMVASKVENLHMKVRLSAFVAFGQATPFAGKEVRRIVRKIREIVAGILEGVEAETTRLKAAIG